ncbi:hypothetical protein UFOVP393_19 [uncultured Caudovirales phage]|uniref:Uncharacterized protein n=1 Tax=uncultured Caudovirales phage TaxID=2100421 RepID=A0A6J7X3Q7_9CAUD|nr:hypothetical protein UFOVP393_19 [uncultured Caudovirales phage]
MSTSSAASFNLQFTEIAEEAYERCGVEMRTGYQLKTARRSLNLLTIEWANRGINLWTIEQGEIALQTGQLTYALPLDTIDLLDHVVRQGTGQNQIDINITRISETSYSQIPNKYAQGRPIQVWINRQSGNTNKLPTTVLAANVLTTDTTITVASTFNLASAGYIQIGSEIINYTNVVGNVLQNCVRGQANTAVSAHSAADDVFVTYLPNINVWPTPNAGGGYTFVYWRMRRIQDAGSGVQTQDIPFRFIPCMVAGLAYHLSMKLPEATQRVGMLKQAYDEQWDWASTEDREKASLRLAPRQMFY